MIATTGPRPHLSFTAIWQSHHWRRRRHSISASSDGPNHNLLVIIFGQPHFFVRLASRSSVGRNCRLSAIRHNHLVRRPIERRPQIWPTTRMLISGGLDEPTATWRVLKVA